MGSEESPTKYQQRWAKIYLPPSLKICFLKTASQKTFQVISQVLKIYLLYFYKAYDTVYHYFSL